MQKFVTECEKVSCAFIFLHSSEHDAHLDTCPGLRESSHQEFSYNTDR